MAQGPPNPSRMIPVAVLLVAIGLVAVWLVVRRFLPDGPPVPALEPLTAAQVRALLQQKSLANAGMENLPNDDRLDPSAILAAFEEIARQLPDEPLGARNALIARLLLLSRVKFPYETDDDRQAARAAFTQAEAALARLRTVNDDPAVVQLLAAKLAAAAFEKQLAADFQAVVDAFQAAAHAAPADKRGPIWSELYSLMTPDVAGEALQGVRREALAHAYAADRNNLALLLDWLNHQAEHRDGAILQTLTHARQIVLPLAAGMIRYGDQIPVWLDEIQQAAAQGNDVGWQAASAKLRTLTNVLKPEPFYQQDRQRLVRFVLEFMLHDFSPGFYARFELPPDEPPAIALKFTAVSPPEQLPERAGVGAVRLADFDLDGRLDVIVVRGDRVEVFGRMPPGDGWTLLAAAAVPPGMHGVVAVDLDRDLHMPKQADAQAAPPAQAACADADVDLVVFGSGGIRLMENHLEGQRGTRSLRVIEENVGEFNAQGNVTAAAAVDLDHDGDLDLVVASSGGVRIWTNREGFQFMETRGRAALLPPGNAVHNLVPVDWDRDVLVDLIVAGASPETGHGVLGVIQNGQHTRLRWRELEADFRQGVFAVALIDADQNGSWDLLAAGSAGIHLLRTHTQFAAQRVTIQESRELFAQPVAGIMTWDCDNDGYRDIVAWSERGVDVLRGGVGGAFHAAAELFESPVTGVTACDVGDLDRDGDEDLLVATADGIAWLRNDGGNRNHWVDVALSAERNPKFELTQRSNMHGIGSLVELFAGGRSQRQVVSRQETHFGLGRQEQADVVRVLWTNGIPQNELRPPADAVLCQDQRLLTGSCPYLYTWTGQRYEFLTDLLWAAPLGLQSAEGALVPCREWEYIHIPGDRLRERAGEYRVQITEELWEVAYFDLVELLAVDHPDDVAVYSNEKVGPAEIAEFKVHTVRRPRTPVAARDKHGRDLLPLLSRRDERYARAFDGRIKQGLVDEHYLELDLGPLDHPRQITLFLTGWTYPTDVNLNVAISQNPRLAPPKPPAVWTPVASGQWQCTIPYMGFPGGKTKTIAVDLSRAFLTNDFRLRIVTSMELYWDEVFFTVDEAPAPFHVKRLKLLGADLHDRGVSRREIGRDGGPDRYRYEEVITEPVWPPMQGCLTRLGDVTELLTASDDFLVVLGAGDELTLRFAPSEDPPPQGWTRDFLLHSVGWDKDANLNTVLGRTVEPLPFQGMSGYPPDPQDGPRDGVGYRRYLERYHTRRQSAGAFWKAQPDSGVRPGR